VNELEGAILRRPHDPPELQIVRWIAKPVDSVQWLSDNGPQYTATASVFYAHELGFVPIMD